MALDDLRGLTRQPGDVLDLARRGADADDRAQREAERARVDLGPVAGDGPALLKPLKPLGHSRRRETHPPAQFGERQPPVALKLGDQKAIRLIEWPIRSHIAHNTVE